MKKSNPYDDASNESPSHELSTVLRVRRDDSHAGEGNVQGEPHEEAQPLERGGCRNEGVVDLVRHGAAAVQAKSVQDVACSQDNVKDVQELNGPGQGLVLVCPRHIKQIAQGVENSTRDDEAILDEEIAWISSELSAQRERVNVSSIPFRRIQPQVGRLDL